MQSLVVQALAMRQLGRLNPRHLLATGYGLGQSEWCPRAIHTRQLWGCAGLPFLGCHRVAGPGWPVHQLRFKSSKKKGAARTAQDDEDEDDDEEDKDPEDSDYDDEVDENPNLPKDYKDMEKFVQSLRYDAMMKAGLDIARK